MTEHHEILRLRTPHQQNRVTSVELLYDLVFVFAVTQLSHTLMAHFTLASVGETVLLLMAVWTTWIYTTWTTNWLNPDHYGVRFMLFILMLAGLILSASIPTAFGARGLTFAASYVFMHFCRTIPMLWVFRDHPPQLRNSQRIAVWITLSAIFWLAGGLVEDGARVLLWFIAISLEFVSPLVRFWVPVWGQSSLDDWVIEGAHMAERCGLFIIIVLGESILVTGTIISDLVWTGANIVAFVVSFVGSLLLWWLYFDRSAEAASRVIAEAPDAGRLARSAYTYSHVALVAGIILLAVADEFILSHPTGETSTQTMCALLGGTALYLVGNLLIKWQVWRRIRSTHVVGLILLALLIPTANFLSPLWMNIATVLILIAIAAAEQYYYLRHPVHFPEAATAPSE